MSPDEGAWELVEIMGRRQLAGYVTEVVRFGAAMMRIDVPGLAAAEGRPAVVSQTLFFAAAAIFSETEITEEAVKLWVKRERQPWAPLAPALAPVDAEEGSDEDDGDCAVCHHVIAECTCGDDQDPGF